MAVTAPSADTAGAALDAQIATVQALVNANANPVMLPQLQELLNQLQVAAVNYYMATGWLNAGSNVLATYSAPAWDAYAQALTKRVSDLQAFYNSAPAMPVGNAEGYGDSGWTTIASNYLQQLYAAQVQLVQRLMDIAQPTAATILSSLTGVQTDPAGIPYAYVFNSVGFTDAWIDD